MTSLANVDSNRDGSTNGFADKKLVADIIAKLSPQHLTELRGSGLSDVQIHLCGFYSEASATKWSKLLGWKSPPPNGSPALCIPFFDADGKRLDYVRVKPDKPRTGKNKKPIKYESPMGSSNRAYFPPATRLVLSDATKPIVITEGEKKAAKADQDGFHCIGLVGVYGWQKARPKDKAGKGEGARELIPDLTAVNWTDRVVYIAFDSDIVSKPEVAWAEWHLAEALVKAGAKVLAVRIPAASDESKQGLDDLLVSAGPATLNDLLSQASPVEMPADTRPVIVVDHEEHRVINEAVQALASETEIYQRGGMLVQIVETESEVDDAVIRRPAGSPLVRELPTALLRESLTRCAQLKRWAGSGENARLVPTNPSEWLVNGVYKRHVWPGVRRLHALVNHPILLPDGTVLATPGYHSKFQINAALPSGLQLAIPDNPDQYAVKAALATLLDPLIDFPFETPAHRSAWLAGLLTPLAWFAFDGPAPLFLIDGNVRGLGKSLLADVIALIVTGGRFATMAYTNDREELRKKITSLAVEGERLVLLDNLAGNVGNDVLDNALTSCQWKDRLLGGNRTFDGPLNISWFGSSNNAQLLADTARRVCHIRLESADEKPETKSGFKYPRLREHIRVHRGELLSAALTILRAWYAAGKPSHNLLNWGSYEAWSMIRDVVVFAGLDDPGETRQALQSNSDRDAAAMETILRVMRTLDDGRRGLTAADIIGKLKDPSSSQSESLSELRSAVEELCGRLDGRTLAYKLRSFKHRNFAGMRLVVSGEKNGSNRWTVELIGSKPTSCQTGDTGDQGDVFAQLTPRRKIQLPLDWESQMLPD